LKDAATTKRPTETQRQIVRSLQKKRVRRCSAQMNDMGSGEDGSLLDDIRRFPVL
jgi:hypothetical protein